MDFSTVNFDEFIFVYLITIDVNFLRYMSFVFPVLTE